MKNTKIKKINVVIIISCIIGALYNLLLIISYFFITYNNPWAFSNNINYILPKEKTIIENLINIWSNLLPAIIKIDIIIDIHKVFFYLYFVIYLPKNRKHNEIMLLTGSVIILLWNIILFTTYTRRIDLSIISGIFLGIILYRRGILQKEKEM